MSERRNVIQYTGKPYLSIPEASRATGLAICWLRKGCRENKIPHIMAGSKYMVCVPLLLQQLEAESMEA